MNKNANFATEKAAGADRLGIVRELDKGRKRKRETEKSEREPSAAKDSPKKRTARVPRGTVQREALEAASPQIPHAVPTARRGPTGQRGIQGR